MARKIKKTLLYIALTLLALTCLLPFLLMIINATRTGTDIMKGFTFKPGTALFDNWKTVSEYMNLFRGLGNSLFVAAISTALSSYFSALTAYGLAIYKFKGRNVIFGAIMVFMMIPGQLALLGFYDLVNAMGLVDSYIPLIIPAIASPAVVFFLRQFLLSTLSPALLDAARIDGATEFKIFHKIALPIMGPGIATMAIGSFIGSWNNYLMPMILLTTPDKFTLPVMVASMNASQDIVKNQGAIYLAVAISVIPVLISFAFFSKYIIGGISAGGVKE